MQRARRKTGRGWRGHDVSDLRAKCKRVFQNMLALVISGKSKSRAGCCLHRQVTVGGDVRAHRFLADLDFHTALLACALQHVILEAW